MLLGTYNHSLDAKNRLTLPSKLRIKFANTVMVTLGVDGCIELRTPDNFSKYSTQLSSWGSMKEKARAVQRMISANTFELQIDSSSRILIPNVLIQYARISKDITLVGVNDKLEIWDSSIYNQKFNKDIPLLSDLMEELDEHEA